MKSLIAAAAFAVSTLATPALAELKAGSKAPDFTAPAFLAGQPFTYKLADALKKGPVVVISSPPPTPPAVTSRRTCSPTLSTSSRLPRPR